MNRKPLPDLLKGIAVLLMIQVHIMELFMQASVYNGIFGKMSLFLGAIPAAPVFMLIMGYFAGLSSKNTRQQITRGIQLIFIGLVLNIGLNAHLLLRIFSGEYSLDPLPYILGVDILFLAGLSLIFIAILKLMGGRSLLLFIAFTFLVVLAAEFVQYIPAREGSEKYLIALFIRNVEWSYFPFFPWAGWVLAGTSFALLEESYGDHEIYRKYSKWLAFAAGIPVLVFFPWALNITTELPLYYGHGVLLFLWGLSFCLLWVQLINLILVFAKNAIITKYLQWLGKNVTLAYIIQWLLIGNIATAIYRTQPGYMFLIYLAGILLITSILSRIVSPFLSSRNSFL